MEMIPPDSREKTHRARTGGFAVWAAFNLPDRASLKRAFLSPIATPTKNQGAATPGPAKKNLRRGSEGQALVEFALTLPFLLILFVVLVELGLLIRSHMTITGAVREGVRAVSSRGNADPSALYSDSFKNQVNSRVGVDGDTLLTQNVNTALQQERASVTLLMTYRADVTDGPTYTTDTVTGRKVPTTIGYYGIGGQYGVEYNPAVSLYPFQEVFSYTLAYNTNRGVWEKFFNPYVMSVNECKAVYGTSEPAKPAQATAAGNTFAGTLGGTAGFCGDATNVSGVTAGFGINRAFPLGTNDANSGNASALYSTTLALRYPGDTTKCNKIGGTGSDKNDVTYNPSAIQCWRYNYAPWYPSLRYALDFTGNNVNLDPTSAGYYNYQTDDPTKFGDASVFRSPDYAGVQIVYTHKWLLTFFPGALQLSDKAVKIMEPVGGGFTKPGS